MPWRSVVPMEEKIRFIGDYLNGVFYFMKGIKSFLKSSCTCHFPYLFDPASKAPVRRELLFALHAAPTPP
jgi:hypothetical protein